MHFGIVEYVLLHSGVTKIAKTSQNTQRYDIVSSKISPVLTSKSCPDVEKEEMIFSKVSKETLGTKVSTTKSAKKVLSTSTDGISIRIRECGAKGCHNTNVTHIYQGYFCEDHSSIIKMYRIVVDKNLKDLEELKARIEEQSLRKIPHPLYQKDIDALSKSLKF